MNSLHKGQWCRALKFTLICAWTKRRVHNRDAGDLRCHRAHYDVTVMEWWLEQLNLCGLNKMTDAIFKYIFLIKKFCIWLKFHWSFLFMIQSVIGLHWFNTCLVPEKVTSHYLNQWWWSVLMYKWIPRPQWVNDIRVTILCLVKQKYVACFTASLVAPTLLHRKCFTGDVCTCDCDISFKCILNK